MMKSRGKYIILVLLILVNAVLLVFLGYRVRHILSYRREVLHNSVPAYDEHLSYHGYCLLSHYYYLNGRDLLPDEDMVPGDRLAAFMEDAFFCRAFSENGMTKEAEKRKVAMTTHEAFLDPYREHVGVLKERIKRP